MVPVRLEQDSNVVWKNPSPYSATSTRLIYLLHAGESEDKVKMLIIKATDDGHKKLRLNKVIETDDGITYDVKHDIVDSMKDLKLKKRMVWSWRCRLYLM